MRELIHFDLPNVLFVGVPGEFVQVVVHVGHGLLMRGRGGSIRRQPRRKYRMLTRQRNLLIA